MYKKLKSWATIGIIMILVICVTELTRTAMENNGRIELQNNAIDNERRATEEQKQKLDDCINESIRAYNDWLELNMEDKGNGNYYGEGWKWNIVREQLKEDQDRCNKLYK